MSKLCRCGSIVKDWCHRCYPRNQRHKKTTKERGYDSKWKELRIQKLTASPVCEECERKGLVTPATEVHHIHKIKDRPELRLCFDNLMSVCRPCHDAIEDK